MARSLAVVFGVLAMLPAASAYARKNFLATDMQPEVVARTLQNVQEEWKAQAALFAECNSTSEGSSALVDCSDAPKSFAKSCSTVVKAVVSGSSGDKNVVQEYMTDVCGQSQMQGWHQTYCKSLATALDGTMSADTYENRNDFNAQKLCTGFWSQFLKDETARLAEEKIQREAAEKKAAEEAAEREKKAKEEAEAEAKKQAEEAEKKAQQEAEEEKKRELEEAAKQKAEAEARAAEAAEKLKHKKAEAEAVAKAAEEKRKEADEAEKAHKEALQNLTAHVNSTAVQDAVKLASVVPAETKAETPATPAANASAAAPASTEKKEEPAATVAVKNVTVAAANATATNASNKSFI